MPIVFVHGVNNRKGSDYEDNEVGRNAFIKAIVAPALGLDGKSVVVRSPYWGGNGVAFAWDMAVLPEAKQGFESFAGDAFKAVAEAQTAQIAANLNLDDTLVESARKDFPRTVEALYASMLAGVTSEDAAAKIAASYAKAEKYAADDPHPAWLDDPALTDADFAAELNDQLNKLPGESFGAGGLFDQLKEGASRLINALPKAGSDALIKLGRKKLNTAAGLFSGDAFVYLQSRGDRAAPGPIIKIVLDDLRAAAAAKTATDNKLLVIAHSFGGEIMYDILTHFAPELEVDVLVTAGSQVGLFEEMKLFKESTASPPPGKVPMPKNVGRWMNVFDTNDILSYTAEPVFEGVEDYHYDTGFAATQAHGGYFVQPSFYARLAERLKA